MALNFDSILNNSRSVMRGEAPGSVKFLAAALLMLTIWVGVYLVHGKTEQSKTQLATQQGRWRTLLMLANEYKSLSPEQRKNNNRLMYLLSLHRYLNECSLEAVSTG